MTHDRKRLPEFSRSISLGILLLLVWPNLAGGGTSRVDAIVRKAERLRAEQLHSKAQKLIQRSLKSGLEDPVLKSMLADIHLVENNFDLAKKLAAGVIAEHPEYPWPYLLLAKAQLNLGRYKLSLATLKKYEEVCAAAGETPQDLNFLSAMNLYFLGKRQKAERRFAAAQKNIDDASLPYLLEIRSWNLQLMNRMDEAESILKSLIKKHPREPRFRVLLAKHLNDRRRFGEAYRALRKAANLCPKGEEVCDDFLTAYDEDFFVNGELSGIASPYSETPFSLGLGYKREAVVSDVESLALGLRTQGIEPKQKEYLLTPHLNAVDNYSGKITVLGSGLPYTAEYVHKDYVEKDPSRPYAERDLLFKTEFTTHTRFGDLTIFPGIRLYKAEGRYANNENVEGGPYEFVKPGGTVTFLLAPWHGWTYLEAEVAFGRFYELESNAKINDQLQRLQVAQRLFGDSFLKIGYVRSQARDISSDISQTRHNGYLNLDILTRHIELRLGAEHARNTPTARDSDRSANVTNTYKSSLGVGLINEVMISASAEYTRLLQYEIYDYDVYKGRLAYYFEPAFHRELAERHIRYTTRLKVFAGIDQVRFKNKDWHPDRQFQRNDRAYVAGLEWR